MTDGFEDTYHELERKKYNGEINLQIEGLGTIAAVFLYAPKFAYYALKGLSVAKREREKIRNKNLFKH